MKKTYLHPQTNTVKVRFQNIMGQSEVIMLNQQDSAITSEGSVASRRGGFFFDDDEEE